MTLVALIIAMAMCGAGLVIGGVYLLAGAGSAFVLAGLFALAGAALLTRGLTPRGG